MLPVFAERVTPGNVVDDVDAYAADWVIEAVFEDLAVKRELYATIERHRGPGTMVTSNTSTIPLARLVEGRDRAFTRHFAITHFFNPPRHLPLLELVESPEEPASVIVPPRTFAPGRVLRLVRCPIVPDPSGYH